MPKTYKISTENVEEIKTTRKTIKDKTTDNVCKCCNSLEEKGLQSRNSQQVRYNLTEKMVSHLGRVICLKWNCMHTFKKAQKSQKFKVRKKKRTSSDFTKQSEIAVN